MATFEDLMNGFGVVTVMNACIYELDGSYTNRVNCCQIGQNDGAFTPKMWKKTGEIIDTLKIANITQEGPTKTITGGQYANPLIKYGKTATMEMQDALGRAATLKRFFGCIYQEPVYENETKVLKTPGILSVTDKFPGAFAIEGTTFFIDQETGEKVELYIFIPQFLPDAILNLTQDAEGDATVFDLNGSVSVTKVADCTKAAEGTLNQEGYKPAEYSVPRDIFYEIRQKSFFLEGLETAQEANV